MALTLVLSVGLDPELLGTRNLVLQTAGYTTVRAYSLKAAVECFQTLDFDVIVLCQTIPAKDRGRLTAWIRASGSRIPVVAVSEKACQDATFAGVTVGSDADALVAGLQKALNNHATPAARTATPREELAAAARWSEQPEWSGGYEVKAIAGEEDFHRQSRYRQSNTDSIYFPTHHAAYSRGHDQGKNTEN